MVLWVIAILSVVVLEFCFAMRTEVNIAQNFKEETQRYAMAEGGIERAIAELIYRNDARMQQLRKTLKPEEVPAEKREWVTDGRPYVLSFDQGTCEVRAMGEAGKVNINIVSDPTLRKIIGQFGLEGEARDVVVDSILDWRTPGELHRLNGAKSDYYQSLKEPYDCKNGNFDSVEELLLVRGVTPELFYGRKKTEKGDEVEKVDRVGLKDIFSIYASGEQVDINSASATTLRIVLGIPNEVAQQIVKARAEKGYDNPAELLQRVPEFSTFMGTTGGFILFQSLSPYYAIESRAKNKDGGSVRGVKVIVKIDSREKAGYKIIQWVDVIL
jgi:general secretion pathway protein K